MNDRIRVLHLLDSGRPGGITAFVRDLAASIDRSRFEIGACVMGAGGPVLDEFRGMDMDVITLNEPGRFGPVTAWRYFRHIRSRGYEILHANVGARLPRHLARLAGCRAVIAHGHGPPEASLDRIRLAHPGLQHEFEIAYGSGSDVIIACSQSLQRTIETFAPTLRSRTRVMYSGVDTQRFSPLNAEERRSRRFALGIAENAVVVGFVGRLIPLKRLDLLIQATARLRCELPDARVEFLVLGDGPLRPALEEQATQSGVPVRFVGTQPASTWLPLFDILALASQSEGLPMSVLEAMAVGVAVVATAVGGLSEVVVNGETGLLVPPGDGNALLDAMRILVLRPEWRRAMGTAARARAVSKFDSQTAAAAFESLYLELLAR
jgi:glycosyltransferase involved in cell wall biosynthesis